MQAFPTLGQCLIDTGMARLRIIARTWGVEIAATRQVEAAIELARDLAEPSNAAAVWEGLGAEERAALTSLLDAGGYMPAAVFGRRFGQIRPIGPGRLEREEPWRDPVSVAENLWYRGLIYEGFARGETEAFSAFFIPEELRAALPVKADTVPFHLALAPALAPTHSAGAYQLLLDDLTTLLAFIHNNPVQTGDGGLVWTDQNRAALTPFLRDSNADRLEMCLHLLRQLGWTRTNEEGRLRLVGKPVMHWLKRPEAASREQLVDAWLKLRDWSELWSLARLEPDAAGTWRIGPEIARKALLRFLAVLPPDDWVRVDAFVAAVKTADPDFLRPAGKYDEWYVRDVESGAYLSGFESWDHVEGAVLRAILQGPAWWLGLIEIGDVSARGSAEVFRPLSTDALGNIDDSFLARKPAVLPDGTIRIPSLMRFERFQLARVADLVRVGEVDTYRISAASLRRAERQHIDLEKTLGFLQSLTEAPLPQTLVRSLEEWYQRGTQVWLERTVLLRVESPDVMQRIMASAKVSKYVDRTLNATTAVVAEKSWSQLVAALAELGFLVDLEGLRE
jgi:hypothetical protein